MTNVRQNWYPAILMALAAAAPSFAENAAPSMETFAKLPLAFERNQGQADSRVAFMAHGIAYSVFLTKQEAVLTLAGPEGRSNVLRMGLASANPNPAISGLERLAGQSNYLIGNDHTKWHTGVLSFGRVRYEGVYPGIDLVYYGNRGQLEYDFSPRAIPTPRSPGWNDSPGRAITSLGTIIRNGTPVFSASAACGTKGFTPASTSSITAIAGSLSMISWPPPAPTPPAFACASPAPGVCEWRPTATWSWRLAARRSASAGRSCIRPLPTAGAPKWVAALCCAAQTKPASSWPPMTAPGRW